MIDWNDNGVAGILTRSFASTVAEAAKHATGMEFMVLPVNGGPVHEIVTSDPNAIDMEYGSVDLPGGSWSVKALIEAERKFGEQPSGGI